jgi:hypothetical protein
MININLSEDLTPREQAVLRAVLGNEPPVAEAPKTRRPRKTAEPTPEPEEPTTTTEATNDDPDPRAEAVARATKLVSLGKSAEVKKVLAKFKVERVSKLKDSDIEAFLAALP